MGARELAVILCMKGWGQFGKAMSPVQACSVGGLGRTGKSSKDVEICCG